MKEKRQVSDDLIDLDLVFRLNSAQGKSHFYVFWFPRAFDDYVAHRPKSAARQLRGTCYNGPPAVDMILS